MLKNSLYNFSLLGMRVVFGGLMLYLHGLGKLMAYLNKNVPEAGTGLINNLEISKSLTFLSAGDLFLVVIIVEVFFSATLIIGFFTRLSAFFLACAMAVAAFDLHLSHSLIKKELALVYLFPFIFFILNGGGKYSIDGLIDNFRPDDEKEVEVSKQTS